MKKKLKINFVIFILIAILLQITYSFAIEGINKIEKENSFFEISQLEVTSNEKIEMTIYFEKINYDKFEFTLKSSNDIENVEVSDTVNAQVEKNNNEITIEIDKSKTNVNQMTLYYKVPENVKVNDVIKFIAIVTNISVEETLETTNVTSNETIVLENQTKEENIQIENQPEEKAESQTIEVQVKIVEKNDEQEEIKKEDDNKNNKDDKIPNDIDDKKMQNDKNKKMKDNEDEEEKVFSRQVVSINNQTTNTSVIYNGSNNNYLSNLSVEGYTLNKEFSKENTTYFITVGNEITSLNINAIAEDDSATVCIYGEDCLEQELNKILISVTAENGNVRNYRIYVTKNFEKNDITNNNSNKVINSTESEIKSSLTENVELHATYYLEESYIVLNQIVKEGERILKYTNGTYLTAPYDCVITEINIPNNGEKCTNSHSIQISSVNNLMVQTNVDESKIKSITMCQEATIEIDTYEDKIILIGNVTDISNTVNNGKFIVTVEFENNADIRLGMTGAVTIKEKE